MSIDGVTGEEYTRRRFLGTLGRLGTAVATGGLTYHLLTGVADGQTVAQGTAEAKTADEGTGRFYNNLAREGAGLNQQKKFWDARGLLEPYAEDPENRNSTYFNELGLACIETSKLRNGQERLADLDKAVILLERSVELNPANTTALYNLGALYGSLLQNYPQAIKYFELYLERGGPQSERVRKSIDYMKKH